MKIQYTLQVLLVVLVCTFFQCKSVPVSDTKKGVSFLALGDSYTIGQNVSEENRWPNQLKEALKRDGLKVRDIKIIAKTGWRTDDLISAINYRLDETETYDVVSVLIGVNNQYQKKSITTYEEDLKVVFEKAIKHSKKGAKGVFALNIPDYGSAPMLHHKAEQVAVEIDEFNTVFKKVASTYKIPVYDINRISKQAYSNETLIASDGLHPSGAQYKLWVEYMLPFVKQYFK